MIQPLGIATGFALAALFALPLAAQRGDDTARKSKNGRVAGVAGGASVVAEYGRPVAAGRVVWHLSGAKQP